MQKFTPRIAAALAAALLFLAGCSGPANQSAPSSGGAPAAAPGAPAAGDQASTERQIARTASVTLVVGDVLDAAARVRDVAGRHNALITKEDLVGGEKSTRSTLVLAVPADQLDAVMVALGEIGTTTNRTQTATDVTEQVVDVDARIRTLQDSIARIRSLMDRAGSVTEIASVERELTQRQSELEALLAQQKSLKDRVTRTPVTVTLTTQPPGERNPFLDGLFGAWEAMQASLRVVLTLLGALVPVAVLGGVVWLVVRAVRGRRPKPVAPPMPPPMGPPVHQPPVGQPPTHQQPTQQAPAPQHPAPVQQQAAPASHPTPEPPAES